MGDFRVTVEAVGGHGCQREKGDGEYVVGCERPGCPDCIAREFVRRLKRSGATMKKAEIVHWPADLAGRPARLRRRWRRGRGARRPALTARRTGAFPEREQYLKTAAG